VIGCWSNTLTSSLMQLGKSASETLQMLTEAYDTDSMKKSSVFGWHKRFKEGQIDV
jgi:hypothetical protein